uniref:Putative secreted protein n=1 Tax=Anopheles marajoara TaxID=58244 RepID=A0A2M4CAC3_9DIPT
MLQIGVCQTILLSIVFYSFFDRLSASCATQRSLRFDFFRLPPDERFATRFTSFLCRSFNSWPSARQSSSVGSIIFIFGTLARIFFQ